MTLLPCTSLLFSENIAVAIYGPYIYVFDVILAKVLQATSPTFDGSRETLPISASIRNVAIALASGKLVTIDEQKKLKVWDLRSLHVLSSRELPKKANQVLVTKDGNTILVADKFGDVFSYPMEAPELDRPVATPKQAPNTLEGRKSTKSHPNPSQGNLILGHTSSLTTMSLTLDERFILTADRDEHIRVSHFPRGYDIEQYCLGHTKYISAMKLPDHTPDILISGGGDKSIFFWDYLTGILLNQISIRDIVYPSMKVFSQRRKFQKLEAKAGTGWRARKRKAREERERLEREAREKAKMEGSVSTPNENVSRTSPTAATEFADEIQKDEKQEDGEEGDMMAVDTVQGGMAVSRQRSQLPSLEDVIVISKIETLQFGLEFLLVFTAVGSDVLFYAPYDPATSALLSDNTIYQYTLSAPILDFAVHSSGISAFSTNMTSSSSTDKTAAASTRQNRNRIWVAIDRNFSERQDPETRMSTRQGDGGKTQGNGTGEVSTTRFKKTSFPPEYH
ncbi:hypothetical protein CPB86DRAFT_692525 [Serendipita vermifera]|nr:hypothetical protein CPB86DRAFT_692525 [Serendipita vermifera]